MLFGDADTSLPCNGSARPPLLKFHGSRSAASSAAFPRRLAPTGVSLKAGIAAYCSASLRFDMQIIAQSRAFVNRLFRVLARGDIFLQKNTKIMKEVRKYGVFIYISGHANAAKGAANEIQRR